MNNEGSVLTIKIPSLYIIQTKPVPGWMHHNDADTSIRAGFRLSPLRRLVQVRIATRLRAGGACTVHSGLTAQGIVDAVDEALDDQEDVFDVLDRSCVVELDHVLGCRGLDAVDLLCCLSDERLRDGAGRELVQHDRGYRVA